MKRREGLSKLTGREPYVDDLPFAGLWARTVRSPAAHGRIREIRFGAGAGVDWDDVVVVDHRDIPGDNVIHLIEDDQPVLAAGEVRHVGEAVVLVAHRSREAARRAAAAVEVVVDPEPAELDFREAGTVLKHLAIDKGDVEAAFASAPVVVEGVYETGAQEHVYLETQGMMAWVEGEGDEDVVTVRGSMQCPYYVLEALKRALDRDASRVRVLQSATGGGFGGKEEFPSGLAVHAALLALKSRQTVKLIYDRGEDMAVSTKRHPSRVRHRTAVDLDGRLLAQDIEVLLDAGAYVTLSPVVLSRGVIHAAGPYHCENVRIRGRAMRTHTVPAGAFRGFGAPQTHFANECQMDAVARRVGLDPAELRRRNLIRDGQTTATGQLIADGTDRVELLDRALELARWSQPRERREPWIRRGLGLAMFHHGAGFTGSGEVYLDSVAAVAGLADGRVEVRAASTEMGQGTTTIFTRLAADRLAYAEDDVVVAVPDTSRVPDSGPTVASRTVMVVGHLVEKACDDLRRRLGLDATATAADVKRALAAWHAAHPGEEILGRGRYEPPPGIRWDEETYRGDAYGAYGWAAYVADVEVDLRTYTARVVDFVAVQEVGKVIHATLARGQVQGGVVQAIGWALTEECKYRDGALENNQLTNYIIPTSDDVPPIRVEFLENPYPYGAQGAKGLGELPMDGPAPAIVNAVVAALEIEPGRLPRTAIPLTPETLMEWVEGADGP